MKLKFETIFQIFKKIIQLIAVVTIEKLSQKVAAKWTFILLCVCSVKNIIQFIHYNYIVTFSGIFCDERRDLCRPI